MTIKKVLVSQPQPTSEKSPYYDIASSMNVDIVFRPFIKVESLTPREFRQQKINEKIAAHMVEETQKAETPKEEA